MSSSQWLLANSARGFCWLASWAKSLVSWILRLLPKGVTSFMERMLAFAFESDLGFLSNGLVAD